MNWRVLNVKELDTEECVVPLTEFGVNVSAVEWVTAGVVRRFSFLENVGEVRGGVTEVIDLRMVVDGRVLLRVDDFCAGLFQVLMSPLKGPACKRWYFLNRGPDHEYLAQQAQGLQVNVYGMDANVLEFAPARMREEKGDR